MKQPRGFWARIGRFTEEHQWQIFAITSLVAVFAFLADYLWPPDSTVPAPPEMAAPAPPANQRKIVSFSLVPEDVETNERTIEFLNNSIGDVVDIDFGIWINESAGSEEGFANFCAEQGYPSATRTGPSHAFLGKEIVIPLGSGDDVGSGLFGRDNCETRLVIRDSEENVSVYVASAAGWEIVTRGHFRVTFNGIIGSAGVYTLTRQDD